MKSHHLIISSINPFLTMSEQSQPSLVGGHAQYVKGAAEVTMRSRPQYLCLKFRGDSLLLQSAIGGVTGAESWKASGEQDKQQGVDAMKAASAERNPQQSGYGKAEEMAGKVVGCEGMEQEGQESKKS
jgi:hypothetical protein